MSDAPHTILVVDDEAMLRTVFRRWLVAAGYQVIEAASAHEALTHVGVHGESISLVVTDLRMPNMSGEQFINHLVADWPSLPIIAVSGSEDRPPSIPDERFLTKPVSKDVVLRAIAQALRKPQGG